MASRFGNSSSHGNRRDSRSIREAGSASQKPATTANADAVHQAREIPEVDPDTKDVAVLESVECPCTESEPELVTNKVSSVAENETDTPDAADVERDREFSELQQQLANKDELISTLVAELEQVVEQLDRVQRTGIDRSRGPAGGSTLPVEVIEEHQQVLGGLQRVVEQWEALQASTVLERIEAEISDLRSMVSRSSVQVVSGYQASGTEAAVVETSLDTVLARLSIENRDSNSTDSPGPESSNWEAMKRQMLGEPAPESAAVAVDDEEDSESILTSMTPPHPIDLDEATLDGLKKACAERDAFIVQLTRLVRLRRHVSIPDNWDEISEVPEELRARVDHLVSRLEEQVRLAEVEMSLERARLSRERTQIQAERETINKHLKRLGLSSLDELETIAVESGSTSDRRWMRFLGVNRRG